MVVHYENAKFAVVDDGCPGLKIWDKSTDRRADDTGGFYDSMGAPYHPDGLTAARQCADRMERNAKRAEILKRYGYDPTIQESTRDEIRAIVDQFWIVTREEFTTSRLSFGVNPRSDVSSRARYDAETAMLKKFSSPPFTMGSELTNYRISFFAN